MLGGPLGRSRVQALMPAAPRPWWRLDSGICTLHPSYMFGACAKECMVSLEQIGAFACISALREPASEGDLSDEGLEGSQ